MKIDIKVKHKPDVWKVTVDGKHLYELRADDYEFRWVLYEWISFDTVWTSPYDARLCKDTTSTEIKQLIDHIEKWFKIETL